MKIDQLTGLRFVAALAVFFSHLGWDPASSWFGRLFEQGYVGVSFFFVLSGFVLSYSYKWKFRESEIHFRSYALLRIARLVPLHIVTALPFFLMLYDDSWRSIIAGIFNLFLLQSWFPHPGVYFSLNAPSWSLSNEIFFYAMFGSLVFLSDRNLRYAFFVLGIIVLTSAATVFLCWPSHEVFGSRTVSHWIFYIFPLFRLLEFICGMCLYDLWRSGFRPSRSLFAVSVALLLVAMNYGAYIPEEFRYSLFYLPFIATFLFSCLRADAFGASWLSCAWAVFFGKISFAFYLLHQPMLSFLKRMPVISEVNDVFFMLAAMVVIGISSAIAYSFFEKPVETYLRSRILRGS